MQHLIRLRRLWRYAPYCLEAFFDLSYCKIQIIFQPFARYAKAYGFPHCETLRDRKPHVHEQLQGVRFALRWAPKCVPWSSKCLDQAMAAQRMLRRRRLATTLFFGVLRQADGTLLAHAWLRCGVHEVVGYQPLMAYRIVGSYAYFP